MSDAKGVKAELSVGEAAARSGVAVSTLHFYEQKGLIPSFRNSGNQRRYPRAVLRRIAVIKVAQKLGISLEAIGEALEMLPEVSPKAKDWQKLSKKWKSELDDRILKLTMIRDQLNQCIGCGCLSMIDCPLRNPDDALAKEGSGPRLFERTGS